jgi:hypothetical protein
MLCHPYYIIPLIFIFHMMFKLCKFYTLDVYNVGKYLKSDNKLIIFHNNSNVYEIIFE